MVESLDYCCSTTVCRTGRVCSRSHAWDPRGGAGPGGQADSPGVSHKHALFSFPELHSVHPSVYIYDLQTWMGSPSIFVYDCSTLASLSSPSSSRPAEGAGAGGEAPGTLGWELGVRVSPQWLYFLRCGQLSVVLRMLRVRWRGP